jgi:hypothetical protein
MPARHVSVSEFLEKAFSWVSMEITRRGSGVDEKGVDAKSSPHPSTGAISLVAGRRFWPVIRQRRAKTWAAIIRLPSEALVAEMVRADLDAVRQEVGLAAGSD